ncbi:MAG: tetratricopeptide repeat protein [Magnetococcales bacterium]|nr:tetratricopeptide repeat protein [Magnetococcales bacterium]
MFCTFALLIFLSLLVAPVRADDIDDALQLGADALVAQKMALAEEYFDVALKKDSKATRLQLVAAYSGLCASRYKTSLVSKNLELTKRAVRDCDRALVLKSDHQSVYRMRGIAYLTIGDFNRAVTDLNVAVALKPRDHLSVLNRGLAKARLGNYTAAINDFDHAIKLKPDHPWGYYNRGRLHANFYRYGKAVDDFSTFIRFKRGFEPVYLHRGRSRMRLGHYQQAVADFYEAIRLKDGDNPLALAHRGVALYLLGRYEESLEDLEAVVKKSPEDSTSRLWLFLTRERLHRESENTFVEWGGEVDSNSWYGAMSAYLLGRLDSQAVLDLVKANIDQERRSEQESLTQFIFGEWAAVRGKHDEAKKWFNIIVNKAGPKPPWFNAAHQQGNRLTPDPSFAAVEEVETVLPKQKIVTKAEPAKVFREPKPEVKLMLQRRIANLPEDPITSSLVREFAKRDPASIRDGYRFQLGAFSKSENADAALAEMSRLGYESYLQKITINGNTYIRVWVGQFSSSREANIARSMIEKIPGRSPGRVQKK